tara:strand:+ start:148 stop:540 length:393 start_codon:yes stop_codon:yes gene_type:complete
MGLLFWVLATYNPAEHRIYPICAFHRTTDLHCPGCGGLRATHHLTNGRLQEAFRNHPAFILSLPLLTGMMGIWVWHRVREREENLRTRKIYSWLVRGVVALFLILGVLRNLSGPFQKLAPPPVSKISDNR